MRPRQLTYNYTGKVELKGDVLRFHRILDYHTYIAVVLTSLCLDWSDEFSLSTLADLIDLDESTKYWAVPSDGEAMKTRVNDVLNMAEELNNLE